MILEIYKFKSLLIMGSLRLAIVISSAYLIINSSILKLILGVELSVGNKIFTLLFIFAKIILAMIIEVIFTTEINFDPSGIQISSQSISRINKYFLLSLLAELFLFIDLLFFLNFEQLNIQYLLAIKEGISFFLLLNISYRSILIWLAILFNVIAIIILLKPDKNDYSQKNLTTSSIIIFLRNLFLPL